MDRWARWLLETRFGGDPTQVERTLEFLRPIRDRVVANARIEPGDVVLDVGAGDGLIGFAALERVGTEGRVLFSDVSDDLLEVCRELADGDPRAELVHASADDLEPIGDESVDVVTTRSVLIYLHDKERAFAEFFRVLRPGGRLSIFEPINRWEYENRPPTEFWGFDASAIADLVAKVMAAYQADRPPVEESPMFDFDERDLVRLVRAAGFEVFRLEYEAAIEPEAPTRGAVSCVSRLRREPERPDDRGGRRGGVDAGGAASVRGAAAPARRARRGDHALGGRLSERDEDLMSLRKSRPMTVPEARIEQTEAGLAPTGPGWFVANARELCWRHRPGRGNSLPFTGFTDEECETYSVRGDRAGALPGQLASRLAGICAA